MNRNDTLAKYVRKVCVAQFDDESKPYYSRKLIGSNNDKFSLQHYKDHLIKVGEKVLIAKPIHTLKHYKKQFEIHEIIFPADKFYFEMLLKAQNRKDKRMIEEKSNRDRAGHWFKHRGNRSFLVFKD